MKWQKRHDVILKWIDSCKTLDQLINLIPFIRKQDFDYSELLTMISLKSNEIYANVLVKSINKLVNSTNR